MPAPPPPPPERAPPPPPSRAGRVRVPKRRFGDGGELDGPARAFRSAPLARRASVSAADERAIPEWCAVGARVLAEGWHGGRRMFRARVLGHRDRFPRVIVAYEANEAGATDPLSLPTPKWGYAHAGQLQQL